LPVERIPFGEPLTPRLRARELKEAIGFLSRIAADDED